MTALPMGTDLTIKFPWVDLPFLSGLTMIGAQQSINTKRSTETTFKDHFLGEEKAGNW